MKTIITLLIVCFLGAFSACNGQTSQNISQQKETVQKDSGKQMNLLDEQTKMFGQIFDLGGAGEDNPVGDATNYLELIEKIEAPETQKKELREQYKLYDLSLDPKKKDSLKLMVNKMLTESIEKSQVER